MDLDEAIQHCEEVADEKEEDAILYHNCATYKQNLYEKGLAENTEKECRACAEEHRQLAEWLKELKAYREQSGDAISRQAVLDLMRGLTRWCVRSEDGKWNNVGLFYDDVMFGIDRLPSVTPQQRTGRWIKQNYGWNWQCSECGFVTPPSAKEIFTFCPNCGCKMEVEE